MLDGSAVAVVTRVFTVSVHGNLLSLSGFGPNGQMVLAGIHSLGVVEI